MDGSDLAVCLGQYVFNIPIARAIHNVYEYFKSAIFKGFKIKIFFNVFNIGRADVFNLYKVFLFCFFDRDCEAGIFVKVPFYLGNYLGAVKGMLELQNNPDYETLFMVADVHTITTPFDIEELRKNRREVIIDYLAVGLDPNKSIIFQQSEVNEHLELAFYFSTLSTVARMLHLPTYKDKIKQYPKDVTMALLYYPILMASDILIYKAGLVPVGTDQEPHLEVAREIARKMNQLYRLKYLFLS